MLGKYMHKPLYVEAVQVTPENMVRVAEWCGGAIEIPGQRTKENPGTFIRVKAFRPAHEGQTKAFVGDWVVKSAKGYRVFNNTAFIANFVEVDGVNHVSVPEKTITFSSTDSASE